MSAIARAAATIADRPSSGYMPACAALPTKVRTSSCAVGEPVITSPIGAALVVDVSQLRLEPADVEGHRADEADLLHRREQQLDARMRSLLVDDATCRLDHHRKRGVLSAPRIVPPVLRTTSSSPTSGSSSPASGTVSKSRTGRSARPRRIGRGATDQFPAVAPIVGGRVLLPGESDGVERESPDRRRPAAGPKGSESRRARGRSR